MLPPAPTAPAAATAPSPAEDEEIPSLQHLQEALLAQDVEMRLDAIHQISAFVSEAFGPEGADLGAALRESGTVNLIAGLLLDESTEVRAHALLALGNLCSDSVDPSSSATKALLLELGTEHALLQCIASSDESVLLVASATLQNLCHDAAWADRMVAAGVESWLEALLTHADPRVVRYASGALKNLTIASATMGKAAPQLSAHASHAIRQREMEVTLEGFVSRRALRVLGRGAAAMEPKRRLERLLRVPLASRNIGWLDSLSELYAAIEEEVVRLEATYARAKGAGRVALVAPLQRLQSILANAAQAI
jgi:hypothetical protein